MRLELARSKVTAQDQISVPAEVRKRYGIKPGCELGWFEEGGRLWVELARPNTLADVRAVLAAGRPPRSSRELKAAMKAHLAEKFKHAGG